MEKHSKQNKTTPMTMIQALRSAMDVMLERDDNVVIFGQDVGYFGGVFRCTEGLQAKHGRHRVYDAPIRSEEHTSELQSLMRLSYAVFCLTKKTYFHVLPHQRVPITLSSN